MVTMAQFSTALRDGELPVAWSNNFANLGLPLPLFAHQLPAYAGALLILLGLSVVKAYNILMLAGVFLSAFLFYLFAKKYSSSNTALAVVVFMSFFPYRIINIYFRGGLPEIFASAIFPGLLLLLFLINVEKKKSWVPLFGFGVASLALTHPMMLLIFFVPLGGYYLATSSQLRFKDHLLTVGSAVLGLGASAYYIMPLVLEMKYFYQGLGKPTIIESSFLSTNNFLDPNWYYFLTHPGPRGNFIKLGVIELIVLISVVLGVLYLFLKQQKIKSFLSVNKQLVVWLTISIVSILLMLSPAKVFYNLIPGLNQIQYAWRFLAVLQFSIPLFTLFAMKKMSQKSRDLVMIILLIILVIARVPQLYGKNYVLIPEDKFYFTQSNLHSVNLNTIWSDNSENYPKKQIQTEIIEGEGEIFVLAIKNASREYEIKASEPIKVVDYTFYFPGWTVEVDGEPVEIEFQDINFRGLITYDLPPGSYQVIVKYYPTKIRLVSCFVSVISLLAFGAMIITNTKK